MEWNVSMVGRREGSYCSIERTMLCRGPSFWHTSWLRAPSQGRGALSSVLKDAIACITHSYLNFMCRYGQVVN